MRSIRWKLVLMTLAVVFIPVFLLNRYAIQYFDRYTRTDFEHNLRHYARIVGEFYKHELQDKSGVSNKDVIAEEMSRMLKRIGNEIHAGITLLSQNGKVLFSSTEPNKEITSRIEVKEALRGGYSARSRLTPDRSRMYFYIALPVKDDAKHILGVVYIVAHTAPIVAAIRHMVISQRIATYTALAAAAGAALVLALTLTIRLRRLMRETRDFAAGRKPLGKPPRGGDEIAELGRAVHSMADQIEARNLYNREFVQTTLHELKTPMTAIRGAVDVLDEMLEDGSGSDRIAVKDRHDAARFLGKIRNQTERLVQLAGDLRELTRVDTEIRSEEHVKVDYCRFVCSVVDRFRDTLKDRHASLSVNIPDETIQLSIVPGRIEQALSNLLDNAMRYTPCDGSVTVTVSLEGKSVVTEVADTGCGIAASNLSRVFDRFFTTERGRRNTDFGSGLGLAITAGIVNGHCGSIRVESEEGRGTRFVFELPVS